MRLTDKQNAYIVNSTHRWNFKSGAVRSGKSYVDTAAVIPMRIRERAGKPGLNFFIGVSKGTIERNVLQPMRELYTDALVGMINSNNIAHVCGEDVYCLGAEKASQIAKIQGSSAKYVYGDEVAKWNEEVFNMLKSRLDKPYSCFDGALNPESPTHWLKKFLDSDADIYCQKYTLFDNAYLDKEVVKNLCKEYEGTIYYNRLILGEWMRAEGVIYRKFADNPKAYRCEIVEKAVPNSQKKQFLKSDINEIAMGIDFGGTKSGHAFVASGKIRDYSALVALASERHLGEFYSNDIDRMALEFAQTVIDKYGRLDYVYWDNAESVLGRGIKRAFCERFPDVIVRPARKERINDRIQCTLRLMGMNRLYITGDCGTLQAALSSAVWDEKKQEDERLDDGSTDIDSLDSFEYTFERDMKRFIRAD